MSSTHRSVDEIIRRAPGGRNALLRLFVIDHLAQELLERTFAGVQLTASEFGITSVINALGPITPKELARFLGFPMPTLSTHLKRLEARGDVARRPNPDDGRSVLLTLTEEGRRSVAEARPRLEQSLRLVEERLDRAPDEVELSLHSVEHALRDALEATA